MKNNIYGMEPDITSRELDMKCDTAQLIFFSPTKTTMNIIDAIGEGMGLVNTSRIDLTFPLDIAAQEQAADVVVIGTPVYAGRVPALALERLRQNVQGKGRPAVLVVVYGNRAYEDALLELRNVAEELGFIPVGAAAFIGEHSFSTSELPVAVGRPDAIDLKKARNFGSRIREKMQATTSLDQFSSLQVPGNFPYRDGIQPGAISPDTNETLCTLCGECARICPTQVVRVTDLVQTDKSGCIRCSACIKACPTGARFWDVPKIHDITVFLHTQHAAPKEPEMFL